MRIPLLEYQRSHMLELFGDGKVDLSYIDELADRLASSPDGFDGPNPMICPKLSFLGRFFKIRDPYGAGYHKLRPITFMMLENWRSSSRCPRFFPGEVTKDPNIWLHPLVKAMLYELEKKTPGDVLVFNASLGKKYVGYSQRNAFFRAITSHELPLGHIQTGYLLSMVPERMVSEDDMSLACLGDMYVRGGFEQGGLRYYLCKEDRKPYKGTWLWCNGTATINFWPCHTAREGLVVADFSDF